MCCTCWSEAGKEHLLNNSLGCSHHQREAKFRIDLEASHKHHGDKGHTSQYKIHKEPIMPSFSRASDSSSYTPSSEVHTQHGVSLILHYSGTLIWFNCNTSQIHCQSDQLSPAGPNQWQTREGDWSPPRETSVQNCQPLGLGHPSTFHPPEFPPQGPSPTANVLTSKSAPRKQLPLSWSASGRLPAPK